MGKVSKFKEDVRNRAHHLLIDLEYLETHVASRTGRHEDNVAVAEHLEEIRRFLQRLIGC